MVAPSAVGMPLHLSRSSIPSLDGCESRSWLREQLLDPSPIEPDDHLAADHDRWRPTATIGTHELFESRGVLRHVTLDKIDPFLRKILFRGMARASAIGGEEFYGLLAHALPPSCMVARHFHWINTPCRPLPGTWLPDLHYTDDASKIQPKPRGDSCPFFLACCPCQGIIEAHRRMELHQKVRNS